MRGIKFIALFLCAVIICPPVRAYVELLPNEDTASEYCPSIESEGRSVDENAICPEAGERVPNRMVTGVTGEIRHVTSIKLARSHKKICDLEGSVYSPVENNTRFKMDIAGRFKFCSLVSGKNFSYLEGGADTGFTEKDTYRYRWMKGAFAYDDAGQKDPTEARGCLRQLYVGNFRAGFFESANNQLQERFDGFTEDDRMQDIRRYDVNEDQRQSVPLRGLAAKFGSGILSFSGFYSQDSYPSGFPVGEKNADSGDIAVTTRTLEDMADIELFGGYAGCDLSQGSRAGAFFVRDKTGFYSPGYDRKFIDALTWGIEYGGEVKDFLVRAVFSRTDKPVGGIEERNFYFVRAYCELPGATGVILSYKRIEPGYINPAGSVFKGRFVWEFSGSARRVIRDNIIGSAVFIQRERYAGYFRIPSRKVEAEILLDPKGETSLVLGGSYMVPGSVSILKTHNPDGSDRSFSIGTCDQAKTDAKIIFKPSDKAESRFGVGIKTLRYAQTGRNVTGEIISCGLLYRLTPSVVFKGGMEYYDLGSATPHDKSQLFSAEIILKPRGGLSLSLLWKNKYRVDKETVEVNGLESELDSPGFENTYTLSAEYRW